MSQINTNVSAMIAQHVLAQQQDQLNTSLERLSTGVRINSGKDDPAGLIASQNLKSQTASINAAIGNAQRASQVTNIAEGGLQEVSSLLIQVQGLVNQSANDAGLSLDEKKANQQQIDSILQTIDRLASTTSFEGTKLLNGTYDFNISGQNSKIAGYQINGAELDHDDTRAVQVVVTQSAQHAGLVLSAASSALDLTSAGSQLTFELAGVDGSRQFSFASGTTLSSVAAQINTFTSVLGVSAHASGAKILFKSTDFGSNAFVSVKMVDAGGQSGTINNFKDDDANTIVSTAGTALSAMTNAIRDEGQDVGAIINGIAATSDGKTATINTDFLNLSVDLTNSGAQTLQSINAFTITGGGAKFSLGPNVDITNQVSIGIGNVSSRNLGSLANGYLDDLGSSKSANVVDGNVSTAQKIVNDAINQVSTLRGRIGAFQKNVIGTTIDSLNVALENTSAAESSITDTDFASETAQLTRSQILVQAATSALKIAKSQPQSVLTLLQ